MALVLVKNLTRTRKIVAPKKATPRKQPKGKFKSFKIAKYVDDPTLTWALSRFKGLNKDLDTIVNTIIQTGNVMYCKASSNGFKVGHMDSANGTIYPLEIRIKGNTFALTV